MGHCVQKFIFSVRSSPDPAKIGFSPDPVLFRAHLCEPGAHVTLLGSRLYLDHFNVVASGTASLMQSMQLKFSNILLKNDMFRPRRLLLLPKITSDPDPVFRKFESGSDSGVKRNFWLAKFLTSRHVRVHRVIFYISNTLRKLMIKAKGSVFGCVGLKI